jgi:competence protein ComEC
LSNPERIALPIAGLACLSLGAWIGWGRADPVRITFLSVGQGDCAVIQAGGNVVLVDAGPKSPNFDAGERLILPKLRQMGIDRIDLILLSHPDLDHIGGTASLLRAHPEARVGVSAQFRTNAEMQSHLTLLHITPARIDWLGPENQGSIGPLTLRLACPPLWPGSDANDGSMFVRVGTGRAWADFSGDASESVENAMARRGDWSAELMKAGHHGSRTASGPLWLRTVRPEWVVISCGRANSYGHPHQEALNRIAAIGAKVARTDREGDIAFELQGGRFVRITH